MDDQRCGTCAGWVRFPGEEPECKPFWRSHPARVQKQLTEAWANNGKTARNGVNAMTDADIAALKAAAEGDD